MKIAFKILVSFLAFMTLAIAAGFEGPEWDRCRLQEPHRTLMPLKVTTRGGLNLAGYSMGDESRFTQHSQDMRTFFSDDRILAMWGGINAKTNTTDQFDGYLRRWKERAQNNLLSWRLYYLQDRLISVTGSYLSINNGSSYDGGAEILCNTHPDYWRQGVARAVVSSYVTGDMMRSPFTFAWTSAKPENAPSICGVLGSGFSPWEINLEDPLLPPFMKRPGRRFFRIDRSSLEEDAKIPITWVE